jgi:hypothetical protein
MEGQATIHINATPEAVYALISDVTRMGDWSPETTSCEWLDGATGPAVGARFKGTNKMGPAKWSTSPTVTVAEPGKAFAFDTGGTEWRYDLTPDRGGASVTESFRVTNGLVKAVGPFIGRKNSLVRGMQLTLERIKVAAEA